MLIVSASSDVYTGDAKQLYLKLKNDKANIGASYFFKEFEGEHALDKERFDYIINWFKGKFGG